MSCGSKKSCCSSTNQQSGDTHSQVQEYYGKEVKTNADLKTSVCTLQGLSAVSMKNSVKKAFGAVHEDITSKYYGCGLVIPDCLQSLNVLDLGCGAGQDCFVLSQLVGPAGHVTGIDMTEEQLEVANKYIDYHMNKFGYTTPHVTFLNGYIENLTGSGIKENSIDLIVSNCVINLSPDKRAVLQQAYKVLKDGGQMFFSDIYCDKYIPEDRQKNKMLWGECIAGALTVEDLYTIAKEMGFTAPRPVKAAIVDIDPELRALVGNTRYISAEYSLFKLPTDVDCQTHYSVTYQGGIEESEDTWTLDIHHTFRKGLPQTVDGQVGAILKMTRFNQFFSFREIPAAQVCEQEETVFDIFVYTETQKQPKAGGGCCPSNKSCCS